MDGVSFRTDSVSSSKRNTREAKETEPFYPVTPFNLIYISSHKDGGKNISKWRCGVIYFESSERPRDEAKKKPN